MRGIFKKHLRIPVIMLAFMLMLICLTLPAFALRTNSLDLTPGPLRVFKSGSELFGVARTTGVITAAPRATSGVGMYINGSTVTSGDVLRLKTVDATLNGGKFFNCVNTAGSSVFSIAEGGNTAIAGTLAVTGTTTLTGAVQFDSTITSGKSGSNGGLTVKAAGGGTTFSVAGATGNTVVAGTLGVTGASTLTGNTGISGTLAVTGASTLTGALTVKNTITSGLNGADGVAGGITVLSGADPGATTFSVAGATGNTTVEGDLLVRAGKLKIGAGAGTAVTSTAAELNLLSNATSVVQNKRQRVAIGDVNTGVTILPAVEGKGYRIIDIALVAYGGSLAATAEASGVAVSGTQSAAAAALFTVPVASLTQSAYVTPSTDQTVILADGASFVACDDNTAVTVQAVGGSDLITATGIDVIITYVLE